MTLRRYDENDRENETLGLGDHRKQKGITKGV